MNSAPRSPHQRSVWEKTRGFVAQRIRAGSTRARDAILQALTAALGAVGAFLFANVVLGHSQPFFAATSALIVLGFGNNPRARMVLEVAIGCTLGVFIGDLALSLFGEGYIQAVVVIFVSMIFARFLDSGVVFTQQMALQSVLVVLLPVPPEGSFSRSLDAIVGGTLAILITALIPKNIRRPTIAGMETLTQTTVNVLRDCGHALETQESRTAWMALTESRSTQQIVDKLHTEIAKASDLARYSPTTRSTRHMLDEIEEKIEPLDLAVRSMRIVVRRVITVIDQDGLEEDRMHSLAEWFYEAADAVSILSRALAEPKAPGLHRALNVARDALGTAATKLSPQILGANTLQSEALVMLCRPMMIDLLLVTGISHEEALTYLPRL